jgi:hypothetical protein
MGAFFSSSPPAAKSKNQRAITEEDPEPTARYTRNVKKNNMIPVPNHAYDPHEQRHRPFKKNKDIVNVVNGL